MQAVYGGTCTIFHVFRGHVVFEGIYFFFCGICDNRPSHFLRCRFSFLVGWTFAFLLSRCRERKRFYMPLQKFVVQLKTRKNLLLTLKNAFFFVFGSSKGDNGFKNILKWHCRKTFFAVVVLEFYDSCYADAKQYHLASFSTRNSTLNTSLRWPIIMRVFIQLCDSMMYNLKGPFCKENIHVIGLIYH